MTMTSVMRWAGAVERHVGGEREPEQHEPAHGDTGADPLSVCERCAELVGQYGQDPHPSRRDRLHQGQRGQAECRNVEPQPTQPAP